MRIESNSLTYPQEINGRLLIRILDGEEGEEGEENEV
jgi:hypothetical protein